MENPYKRTGDKTARCRKKGYHYGGNLGGEKPGNPHEDAVGALLKATP